MAPLLSVLLLAESTVHVLEEDDGSGWVKVADESGGKGLVPASYLEFLQGDGGQTPRSTTPSLSHQQTSQEHGKSWHLPRLPSRD